MLNHKGAFDVFLSLLAAQCGLRLCPAASQQRKTVKGNAVLLRPPSNQKVDLIESPLPQAFQVQGNGNQEIDRGHIPALKKCLPQKSAQGPGQGRVPSVLEPMNGLHKSAVVEAKGP